MAETQEGLSKTQLKKLAKQAEKQQKKADKKAAAAAAAAEAAAPEASSNDKAASSSSNNSNNIESPKKKKSTKLQEPPPTLLLANFDSNKDSDTVAATKAVWASLVYNVPLKKTSKSAPAIAHGPTLLYGDNDDDDMVFGGNSMAKAIAMFSSSNTGGGSSSSSTTMMMIPTSPQVDDWCEWERVHLRQSHNLHSALGHLEHVLSSSSNTTTSTQSSSSSSPFHLVGHDTTVADICVVTTLSHNAATTTTTTMHHHLPPTVAQYVRAHEDALRAAQAALAQLSSDTLPLDGIDLDHPSLLHVMESVVWRALESLFGGDDADDILQDDLLKNKNLVGRCSNPKHGDYQCNAAMPLFAALKKKKNQEETSIILDMSSPLDVAGALRDTLEPLVDVVTDVAVSGPGFVLCRVAPALLERHMNRYVLQQQHLPLPPNIAPQTCLVDFSSPNIAKEMHVGHLRSTILGESMCRILEKVGHTVHRVNHVGDWGTQFGMLIQYLKEEYPTFHQNMPNITDLTEFYKNAKQRFDEVPEFKKASQINVVRLQSGDEECLEIWKILCDVSRGEFQKVYNRLDITVEECGESFYNDKIPAVLEEFDRAGLLTVEEGGARCVFLDGFQIPLMLQKSDGGYGYDSTDMAALKYRLQELKCHRIIVVTDFSQGDHFKMCYAAAHKIGWVTDQKLEHIGFGTVMGEDGKRFKTRSGDTVRLVDLLDEAVSRMEASLKDRIEDDEKQVTVALDQVHQVAEAIGYGAVKYFDLRRNPTSNYKFSYDQMLDTKGNTAVYLLYAHARLESICAKALADHQVDVNELIANKTPIVIEHASERNLAFHMMQFTDTLTMTLDDLYPYHICEYLYNLSIAASDFATQCKVLGSPEMKSRLLLCRATTMAMRECFDLLAIRHVNRI